MGYPQLVDKKYDPFQLVSLGYRDSALVDENVISTKVLLSRLSTNRSHKPVSHYIVAMRT